MTNINATTAVVRKKYTTLNKNVVNALYATNNHTVLKRTYQTVNQVHRYTTLQNASNHSFVRRHTTRNHKRYTVLDNTNFYLLPMNKIASLERRVAALETNG